MGLETHELQKVQDLTFEEAYFRIKNYYSNFIEKWSHLNSIQKENYIFGSNRHYKTEAVDNSKAIICNLTNNSTLNDAIDLAKNVIYKDLEYLYHNLDENGIKIGAYAHYIINTFNGGKLF